MRKCPKPLINTFAWAIWLKHLALRHIWLLYYKGSVLSIGFVSFFQLFSLLSHFCFSVKKFNSHQCQSLGRSCRSCHFPVAGFQDCFYSLRWILSISYFDQSSGDNTDHVVKKSGSCYPDGYKISVTPHIYSGYCADCCFHLRFCPTEGCKIMLSDQI